MPATAPTPLIDSTTTPTSSPIRFAFDERKATAAAAVLLQAAGGKMRYIRLIKLLYLADRRSLDERARPIVGGRYVAMDYGPVLSEVLDKVKLGGEIWSTVIEKDGYEVRLTGTPDLGPLSREEVELLEMATKLYRKLDRWKIVDLTHALPEWRDPKGSAIDISTEDILAALGKSDEETEEARQDAVERAYFDKLFGR